MLEGALFIFAFLGLVALFTLKRWESAHERVVAQGIRQKADAGALSLKVFMLAVFWYLRKLPQILLALARLGVHIAAVMFGHLAHWIGEKSHALADFVSYKHRFERRETRSEFLKQVIEHPITNREPFPPIVSPAPVEVETKEPAAIAPAAEEEARGTPEKVLDVPVVKKKPARRRKLLSRKKLETPTDNGQNS